MYDAGSGVVVAPVPATHPDLLRRFLRGWFETIAYMKTHKKETVAITAKVIGFDPKIVDRVYDEEIGMFSTDGTFDPAAVEVLKQSYVDMGTLPTKPTSEQMFTTAFVPVKIDAAK